MLPFAYHKPFASIVFDMTTETMFMYLYLVLWGFPSYYSGVEFSSIQSQVCLVVFTSRVLVLCYIPSRCLP